MAETAPEQQVVEQSFAEKPEAASPAENFADAIEEPTTSVEAPPLAAHVAGVEGEDARGCEEENGREDVEKPEESNEEKGEDAERTEENEETKEDGTNGAGKPEDPDAALKFFVGGIIPQATELQIRSYFERFGKVKAVELKMDKMTGRNRGFCFVTMGSEEAKEAIFNAQHAIGGKKVEVRPLHDDGNVSLKRKIFVGGVNPSLSESDVEKCFSKFGTVDKVSIIRDAATGKSRGFGFVVFASEESAKEVLKSKRHNLNEKDSCEVRAAESRATLPPPRPRYPLARAPGLPPPGPRYPPPHAVAHQPHVPPPGGYYAPPRSSPTYYYGPPPPVAPAMTPGVAYYSSSIPPSTGGYAASPSPYYMPPTGVATHAGAATSVLHPQAAGGAAAGAALVSPSLGSAGYYAGSSVPYDAGATATASATGATNTAARGYWDEDSSAGAASGGSGYYGRTASPGTAPATSAGYSSGYSPVRQSPYYGTVGRSNVRRSPY
ncbi:RNA recognition motif-containing protein [Toxoplasma gondii TgCatPRC2]|uniref:RNA binding motif-containing protein n=16 Tax=Toxoplasma gondii TaxID=5811 RepID=B9Q1D4_TOXGV|nr:RNA recognition motif-containing protein [Toxoplasma gondii ME49]EPR57388.1 RNA recognition motif-containing protein [Toxoplasma gondii GT1]ESS33678.1 RNA recognition motif-containing protein [Toxoplasma gondii VEG]KAF4644203.1 RNA recognition motif-containing protein [Toxoplasma gondii]KFG32792.1 RNA recognition motif-containing protein [Toxoplasma gondii p89]KFG38587.1 RNA recognition motif-containing protein [Toxoplasma gondii GAB2-2007-GAL-DOM2]KFG42038.1 RNA recognition motif-containi|eukprot:XP_002368682.1 RNA recognition motif-containing protein [Toxoplasma gondii ME49]